MKKKRFGEETTVIRVPISRKNEILELLKNYEVLDSVLNSASNKTNLPSQHNIDCSKAYMAGFLKGEEFAFVQSLALTGASKEDIALQVDLFNKRIPDSAVSAACQRIADVYAKSRVDFELTDKLVRYFAVSKLIMFPKIET